MIAKKIMSMELNLLKIEDISRGQGILKASADMRGTTCPSDGNGSTWLHKQIGVLSKQEIQPRSQTKGSPRSQIKEPPRAVTPRDSPRVLTPRVLTTTPTQHEDHTQNLIGHGSSVQLESFLEEKTDSASAASPNSALPYSDSKSNPRRGPLVLDLSTIPRLSPGVE